jgi:hypothetical protein
MLNTQHAQHDGSTQPCPLGERIEGGGGESGVEKFYRTPLETNCTLCNCIR